MFNDNFILELDDDKCNVMLFLCILFVQVHFLLYTKYCIEMYDQYNKMMPLPSYLVNLEKEWMHAYVSVCVRERKHSKERLRS